LISICITIKSDLNRKKKKIEKAGTDDNVNYLFLIDITEAKKEDLGKISIDFGKNTIINLNEKNIKKEENNIIRVLVEYKEHIDNKKRNSLYLDARKKFTIKSSYPIKGKVLITYPELPLSNDKNKKDKIDVVIINKDLCGINPDQNNKCTELSSFVIPEKDKNLECKFHDNDCMYLIEEGKKDEEIQGNSTISNCGKDEENLEMTLKIKKSNKLLEDRYETMINYYKLVVPSEDEIKKMESEATDSTILVLEKKKNENIIKQINEIKEKIKNTEDEIKKCEENNKNIENEIKKCEENNKNIENEIKKCEENKENRCKKKGDKTDEDVKKKDGKIVTKDNNKYILPKEGERGKIDTRKLVCLPVQSKDQYYISAYDENANHYCYRNSYRNSSSKTQRCFISDITTCKNFINDRNIKIKIKNNLIIINDK
jgi:hypothetical protein